jgi:uncharacterized protein YjbI with pentapeptide repeats
MVVFMPNLAHLASLEMNVPNWIRWRLENPGPLDLRGADLRNYTLWNRDLSNVDFTEADLSKVYLRGAALNGSRLRTAKLRATDLGMAQLVGADLAQADLTDANLSRATLTDADLTEATLVWTTFRGGVLTGADFSNALLLGTVFAETNLSQSKGLNTVRHHGPSTIGIDTIYQSGGNLPEAFLKGAGVPEPFLERVRALLGVTNPIRYYSCFISHSSLDQGFAERLRADLMANNLRCWYAPEDLKTGDRFQEQIEQSIQVFDKVVIVLSEASVQSRWVEREVNAAREREDRENRTALFPIRIDDSVMNALQPWVADIRRSRHIGDFREWKDYDGYQRAFERLLRDLRANDSINKATS